MKTKRTMNLTKFFTLLLITFSALSFTSCSDEPEDYTVDSNPGGPVGGFWYNFKIEDQFGRNAIKAGLVKPDDLYAVFRGKRFECNENAGIYISDDVLLSGLTINGAFPISGVFHPDDDDLMMFGQLSSSIDYVDEELKFCWKDGTIDVMIFTHRYFFNQQFGYFELDDKVTINGKEVTTNREPIVITHHFDL